MIGGNGFPHHHGETNANGALIVVADVEVAGVYRLGRLRAHHGDLTG